MRTLLFCTAYAESPEVWENRYLPWHQHYFNSSLKVNNLLIVDDASPTRPDFLSENEYHRFENRLGRQAAHVYPGWYRSFSYGVLSGFDKGFDKIIHAESDAFLLSDRIIEFVNSIESGWHTFWAPQHNLHESALQVICRDQYNSAKNFLNVIYDSYSGICMDSILPYTHVHKHFTGDRYGDYLDHIPQDVDYSCQTRPGWITRFKANEKALLQKLQTEDPR